jgi:hypothetical protein
LRGGIVVTKKARTRPGRRIKTFSLEREQAVYDANLARWLAEHESEHVLIKGDDVIGFFATRDEALAAGYARFGVVPLLVKEVAASKPVYHIPNVIL